MLITKVSILVTSADAANTGVANISAVMASEEKTMILFFIDLPP